MRIARIVICAVGLYAGCGDDGGSAANPPATAAAAKGAAAAPGAPGAKNLLPEKLHVEDRVICAAPDKPSDPENGKCDLKSPSCPDRLYCMPVGGGAYCEPCPERDGIRHVFKERDFVAEQNRDPFEPGGTQLADKSSGPRPPTEKCRRDDQFVATTYSYVDLKLVGIIAQGTQRKVLMMGGPLGYIIKRGDCVGKEKAVVTDIGTGYITFQIDPDPLSTNQRPAAEYSVQLNPKQIAANDPGELPQSLGRTTIAPLVAPPPVIPGNGPRGPSGSTVIVPGTPPAPGTVVAPASNIAPAAAGSAVAPPAGSVTGAGSAMAPGASVPLVVPASPAAPGSAAAPAPSAAAPSAAPAGQTPSATGRVFVPAPKR